MTALLPESKIPNEEVQETVSEACGLLFRKEAGERGCKQVYSHPSLGRTCTVCSFQISLLPVTWPLWQNKSLRVLHSLGCSWSFPEKLICHSISLPSKEYTWSTCTFWYNKSKLRLLAYGSKNPSRGNLGPTKIRPLPSSSLNGKLPLRAWAAAQSHLRCLQLCSLPFP